uniref:WH1 domain-containing protein n=1 Tax=Daphnia galeata TaxID=27404 RepID=A0A8J2WP65_9CRUS|nr:unnamed protein product [Daphnia galeata]
MGNRLSSCGPLIRKAYRHEDTPWQNSRKRDGHLLRKEEEEEGGAEPEEFPTSKEIDDLLQHIKKKKKKMTSHCKVRKCVAGWLTDLQWGWLLFALELWAEVFHVSTSSAGTVRWQQISEDLVPVNISCIQDQPDYVFHITAYNSQVDKILDVRLTQPDEEGNKELYARSRPLGSFVTQSDSPNKSVPILQCGILKNNKDKLITLSLYSTRIGQASECFVYWKDPVTNDTWGLNFTSPADARAFRECCFSIVP